MIRLLTWADAPAVRQLYLDTVASGVWANYPGGVNTIWTLERAKAAVAGSLALGYFQPANKLRGFFLVRECPPVYQEQMPPNLFDGGAWQMWLAGVQPGLTVAQLKTALNALTNDGFFVRLAGRTAWAEAPRDAMSVRMRDYLDIRFTHYDDVRNGEPWSVWVHKP